MSLTASARTLAAEATRSHQRDRCDGPSNCPLCAAILDVEADLVRAEVEAFEAAPVPPLTRQQGGGAKRLCLQCSAQLDDGWPLPTCPTHTNPK